MYVILEIVHVHSEGVDMNTRGSVRLDDALCVCAGSYDSYGVSRLSRAVRPLYVASASCNKTSFPSLFHPLAPIPNHTAVSHLAIRILSDQYASAI